MALRSRPDGSAAAVRLAGLLPAQEGGWVPPEPGAAPDGRVAAEPAAGLPPLAAAWRSADQELPLAPASPDAGSPLAPASCDAERPLAPACPDVGSPPAPASRHADQGTIPPPSARSWSGRGAHLADTGRYRLDPGRRGAVALVLAAVLAAAVAGALALRDRPQEVGLPLVEAAGVPLPGASADPAAAGGEVVVAVSGKVRRPGLFHLPAGSRVDDALRAAGGPAPGTDVGVLNLARRLVDGEQVLVGVAPPPGAPAAGGGGQGRLDLNTASASDLDALPGIGPVLAQRIVDWRTENGRFASVDQLREVTGIGEAKYEDLREKVAV